MKSHSLKLFAIVCAIVVLAAACAEAQTRSGKTKSGSTTAPEIEGTWRETVTVPPSPDVPNGETFATRLTFSRGGGVVESDLNPATPGGGVALGAWVKTD